ncbi:hypothetical protein AVEN_182982-1 [Araneus ventricosus]|uniref:Uncharacterized protein n=1 Tax=Araneus ventricosus TaxID=182803 RepID=A0A4Y2NSW1_ARAVE|nr:hypothetical protein AVEN_182982-1 [Araneus ventricosus]
MAKAGNNVRHGPRPISNISQKIQHQKQRFLWLRKAGKPLTLCYKLPVYNVIPPNKTVTDLEPLWWKRVMNNNNSRAKIKKLMHFIAENEPLLFPKDGDDN